MMLPAYVLLHGHHSLLHTESDSVTTALENAPAHLDACYLLVGRLLSFLDTRPARLTASGLHFRTFARIQICCNSLSAHAAVKSPRLCPAEFAGNTPASERNGDRGRKRERGIHSKSQGCIAGFDQLFEGAREETTSLHWTALRKLFLRVQPLRDRYRGTVSLFSVRF